MQTLNSIQKTFHVFQILAKIAYVFSIIGAVFCAVGALCCVAWYAGGQVFSLFGEPITYFTDTADVSRALAVLLSDMVFCTVEAILLGFAGNYFEIEQAEGTPFTKNGADRLKKLGIRCIWMPIMAAVVVAVICVATGTEKAGDASNLPSLVTGLLLILASLIFRYGAELEEKAKPQITEGN